MSELYIPPKRIYRNPTNGRFLKGITPHNKGKKWEEWMDMRKAKRVKRIALSNLKPNMNIGGWNAKKVVAIKDSKLVGVYKSSVDAEKKTGVCARNIRSCCNYKRKTAGGYQWYHESDNAWVELINNKEKYVSKQNNFNRKRRSRARR